MIVGGATAYQAMMRAKAERAWEAIAAVSGAVPTPLIPANGLRLSGAVPVWGTEPREGFPSGFARACACNRWDCNYCVAAARYALAAPFTVSEMRECWEFVKHNDIITDPDGVLVALPINAPAVRVVPPMPPTAFVLGWRGPSFNGLG